MKNKYRILIVEDDEVIARSVQKLMEDWGWEACCVEDFTRVLDIFASYNPHLVILDNTLPSCNGFYWCMEIRKISRVPVVFLSSASDNMNIVIAMNMGGDDFIAKPFDRSVLAAKIQAILRRTYDFAANAELVAHRGAVLNTADATLTYQGQRIDLTKNDYKILKMLLGDCVREFDRLPLVQDADILKNILCVGLWTEFDKKYSTKKGPSDGTGSV